MSFREWQLRIQDILDTITSIQQRMIGVTFDEFQVNETITKAVLYDFIIIGEASANILPDIQSHHPKIPWRLMSHMRNVMAHEYFQVNLMLTWRTIHNALPPLVSQLQDLLAREATGES